jgi:hypothetical protein
MVVTSRTRSFRTFVALAGTALVYAAGAMATGACGSRSTLYAFGGGYGGSHGGDDASVLEDASPDALVGDDQACMGHPIQLTVNAPNLYFVLDHSTSMNENDKWPNVRQVVAQLMTQIGAGARFGAMMFPGVSTVDSCAVGVQILPVQQGDVQGRLANTFLDATTAAPGGGTPTAATLESLVTTLSGLLGQTFVILATDGGPNCDASAPSCTVDACTSNIDAVDARCAPGGDNCCAPPLGSTVSCLDGDATEAAARDLSASGVETFVLGIPGSAAYETILDQVAIAGGTARPSEPRYYQVTTADDAALASAFAQIVQQTGAGCTFTLATPPTVSVGLRAVLNGVVLPESGPNRWSLTGTTLTLFGTSCTMVKSDGAPSLVFYDGCRG